MVNKRIEYVDILKGIGIICVLLGHNLVIQSAEKLPEVMRYIIYSFHMPLFFFLSGYVFSAKGDAITFLKKKIKTIIVPMYIFSLVVILFNCIYYGALLGDNSILKWEKITTSLLPSFLGMELFGCQPTLWFLPCLFATQVLLFFLVKILKNKEKLLIFSLFIMYLIGVINARMLHIKFPFMLERALIAIFFVGIAFVIKTYHSRLIDNLSRYFLILFIGDGLLCYIIY
jgi:fucose 4-O-acetylase-like acetyltransferase